jgi:hypothetical protein
MIIQSGSLLVGVDPGRNVFGICGIAPDAGWVLNRPGEFPGSTPVQGIIGFDGPSVLAVDAANQLWHCGLPQGAWVIDMIQPTFQFQRFLWGGANFIVAIATDGNTFIIGDPTNPQAQWLRADGINFPDGVSF